MYGVVENIQPIAAYMNLLNYTKSDILHVCDINSLLRTPAYFLVTSKVEPSLIGCYIHHNENKQHWIRSGMVPDTIFGKKREHRQLAHQTGDRTNTKI